MAASCCAIPGTVWAVHRGMAVNLPLSSTPRQYSRPESANVSGRLIAVTSHLPRGVSPPPPVRRDFLALHQEGIRGEHRALAQGHAVVDHRAHSDGAAGADGGPVRLE